MAHRKAGKVAGFEIVVSDGVKPGTVLFTGPGGDMVMKLYEPTKDELDTAAKRLRDDIDRKILEEYLHGEG